VIENQNLSEEKNENDEPGDEFPPETSHLMSWSSLQFIRSPSSEFLMLSVIAVFLTCISILILSSLIEMDVTISSSGSIVSDFGSRDAITNSAGEITEIRKNIGDLVDENETLALIKIDGETEKNIVNTLGSLQNLERRIRFFQSSKVYNFNILKDLPETPKIESGQALDAIINLEQQAKFFYELQIRSKKGLDNELRPLRQRADLLAKKIRQIKQSNQEQLLGQALEATEEELGRIHSQISSTENESKLKIEQGLGELLKSIQSSYGALDSYLAQRQIRSPIKGLLSEMTIKLNSSIEANKNVAKIIPENSQLMAGMHVFSKDIVKISEGQKVYYKIEAYPYQTYGTFPGKVLSFEQASEKPELGEYIVYGSIDFPHTLSPELREKMKLIIGMKLQSDIVIERKSGMAVLKKMVFERK
jgi:multidrug efflux pump subunit AcrA (membrane-fusion protein)